MFDNITRETLENLGIYELRNVARQVGVYSPTLYKKEILIEKIMAIVLGEEAPYIRKTNQGRPAKSISGLDEILNIFVPNFDGQDFYKKVNLKQEMFSPSMFQNMKVLPENIESFYGYVKLMPNNYAVAFKNGYFEDNEKSYYITPQMLKESNLKEGDYIKGLFYDAGKDKPKIVKEIGSVNGINQQQNIKSNRVDFDILDAVYPSKQLKLAGENTSLVDFKLIDKICPVAEGARVIVNYDNDFEIDEYIIELANELIKKQRKNVTLLATNERPEDLSYIKNECAELEVMDMLETSVQDFIEQTKIMIEYLKHLVEKGDNQILIIKNVEKLQSAFSKYFVMSYNKSKEEADIEAFESIKAILMSAKSTLSERNFTVIALHSNNQELIELCNCRIYFNQNTYDNTDVYLNCFDSKTLKSNLILSKNDYENLNLFKQGLTKENIIEKLNKLL